MPPTTRTHTDGSPLHRSPTTRLLALCAYAVAAAASLSLLEGLPTAVRLPIGLPLLLFAPGYALLSALFPDDGATRAEPLADSAREWGPLRLSTGERLVLSVVASVAVVPLVAVAANAVVGVQLGPILAGVAAVTLAGSAVGIVRSPSGAVTNAGGPPPGANGPIGAGVRRALSDPLTLVAVALAAVLLTASAALVVVDGGGAQAPNTEFYVADERAGADGTGATFDLRIAQDSVAKQSYTVVAVRGANATNGSDWAEIDRASATVTPGEPATETVHVSERESATTIRFLLYTDQAPATPDPASAHRTLRQSVNGTR